MGEWDAPPAAPPWRPDRAEQFSLAFLRRINRSRRVIRRAGPIACAPYLLSDLRYTGQYEVCVFGLAGGGKGSDEDSAIIVYLKRMSSNYPEIWPDGDFLYEIKRPTAFGQSINDYHASERPWLLADVVFERIGRDDE